jgi:saccharopepsin
MIPFVALLYLLLVALPTDASPLHRYAANPTLSFIARVNAKLGPNIAETDRARAQTMKQAGHKTKRAGSSSFSINNAVVTYTAQVGVGSPPTNCKTTIRCFWISFDEKTLRHTPY